MGTVGGVSDWDGTGFGTDWDANTEDDDSEYRIDEDRDGQAQEAQDAKDDSNLNDFVIESGDVSQAAAAAAQHKDENAQSAQQSLSPNVNDDSDAKQQELSELPGIPACTVLSDVFMCVPFGLVALIFLTGAAGEVTDGNEAAVDSVDSDDIDIDIQVKPKGKSAAKREKNEGKKENQSIASGAAPEVLKAPPRRLNVAGGYFDQSLDRILAFAGVC